jgi:hypothetical protein
MLTSFGFRYMILIVAPGNNGGVCTGRRGHYNAQDERKKNTRGRLDESISPYQEL